MTRSAPSSAMQRVTAAPMPRDAPVTSADFPANLRALGSARARVELVTASG
jgi:hypothetical protein